MTYEDFLKKIPTMDEKDISDFLTDNEDHIMNSPELDVWVVEMTRLLNNKIYISPDETWQKFFIKLCSSEERLEPRITIWQLTR